VKKAAPDFWDSLFFVNGKKIEIATPHKAGHNDIFYINGSPL